MSHSTCQTRDNELLFNTVFIKLQGEWKYLPAKTCLPDMRGIQPITGTARSTPAAAILGAAGGASTPEHRRQLYR